MQFRIHPGSARTLFPALALAAASAPALGQVQPPLDPNTIPGLRLSADEPVIQQFERIAAARMSTSFDSDLVVLSDSRLTFFFQPTRFDWKREFTGTHRDLAVVPLGEYDSVFTVDAAGLREWSFDEPSATYSSTVVKSNWGNVTRLAVTNSGLVAGWDPVNSLIRRHDPNDSSLPTLAVESEEVVDFVTMDWDDNGVDDFVLQHDFEIEVLHGASGELLDSWATTGPDNRIATVRGTGPDSDLLAWAFELNTYWYLHSSSASLQNDGYLVLGDEAPGSMHGADLAPGLSGHAEASEELMLHLGDNLVWVLKRPPLPAPPETAGEGGEGGVKGGSPPPSYALVPDLGNNFSSHYSFDAPEGDTNDPGILTGAGDLDRDGDLEPLFARHADGEITFQLDHYQPETHPIARINVAYTGSGSSTDMVVTASALSRMPAGANYIAVEVWRHDAASEVLDADIIARDFIDVVNLPGGNVDPSVTLDLGSHGFEDVYHVALRAVSSATANPAPNSNYPQYPQVLDAVVDEAWPTFTVFTSPDPSTEPTYEAWPGALAIATLPPPGGTGNDDPVLTGSGTQSGQGSRTPPPIPPIGGVTGTGSTGRTTTN